MRRQRGFNLIDLLIALVISLVGMLAVAVVFRDFGQVRTTQAQTVESQTNGTMALYLIERDLGQAGFGLMNLQNCAFINYHYNGASYYSTPYDGNFPGTGTRALTTLPVHIYDGGAESDIIEIQYADAQSGIAGAEIPSIASYPGWYSLPTMIGFEAFDLAVSNVNGICTLLQIRETDTEDNKVNIPVAEPYNPDASPGGSGWNPVTASDLAANPRPYLANLGNFVSRRYQVSASGTASALTLAEFPAFSANTVVEDIVFMKAQYGLAATAASTAVSTWADGNAGIDNTSAARVIAVRIGVVARSPLYEKEEIDAGPTFVVLPAIAGAGTLDDPGAGECDTNTTTMEVKCTVPDRHYRYRAYSTVVPLKNAIWTR